MPRPKPAINTTSATADEEEVKQQLTSLQEQLALLDQQQAELTVRSPIAGQVLTWDVTQLLAARPDRARPVAADRGRRRRAVGAGDSRG